MIKIRQYLKMAGFKVAKISNLLLKMRQICLKQNKFKHKTNFLINQEVIINSTNRVELQLMNLTEFQTIFQALEEDLTTQLTFSKIIHMQIKH